MGTMDKSVGVLASQRIRLVLVDVGASLEPFPPFRTLLPQATYVGFDPDRRELQLSVGGSPSTVVVDKAVVADPDQDKVRFHLTANPTCSSTLVPSPEALAPWLHAHRFEVVEAVELPATTLGRALVAAGLERMDWIKLDTQGTDACLLRSLDDRLWAGLSAVDAEPGLDPYYEGEDTFASLHEEMTSRGFWLADLQLTTGVRLRRSVFDDSLQGRTSLRRLAYEVTLKRSPMAVGPRYLRTIESLVAAGAPPGDHVRLWACAAASGNHPFALDVAVACAEHHGEDATTTSMRQLSVRANRSYARRHAWRHLDKLTWRNVRHRLRWR